MRILRRGLIPTRSLSDFFLVATAMAMGVAGAPLLLMPSQVAAQSPSAAPPQGQPPADQEWSVRDNLGFRSRNLSTGNLFPIRVDGRTLSPTTSSFQRTSTDRAENESGLTFQAEFSNKPIGVTREMRVDPKRRAVRILDVFTNTDSQERHVRVDYHTSLSERGGVRYGGMLNQAGESREYGNGLPDNTVAALIFAERQDSKALPLFVWGQTTAPWPVNIQDVGSSVSLNYEGTIPANGKVALLHWVAAAGLDKGVKIERTADLFWKDGRLIDPMVPAEIAPLVVNFTPDALKATVPPVALLGQGSGRLLKLEELCGKLGIAREEKDVLWMGKNEHFRGEVTGAGVQLKTESRTVEIPLAGIAAVRGGGGRGREHRLYMRNGAVLTGRVTLRESRLVGELGELTLDADALELLLMRVTAEDGKVPPNGAAFVELQSGAVHWLARQDASPLQLVTVFGALPVSLSDLWSLERRSEPPFNLIATFADGSRVHGVAQQSTMELPVLDPDEKVASIQVRTAEIGRFGSGKLLAKEMALPGSGGPATGSGADSGKPGSEPPSRYCWLRDGSLLVGTLTQSSLSIRTGGNEVELKSEDVTRMTLDAANANLASIELRSGAKMQGELVSESLGWRFGNRTVNLPSGWILELVRKEPAISPSSPPDASTGRNPGENDPLALPKGVPKEDLVEMKVEYPKATAEGPLRVWGTLSLPRLDKCDEESVKKRLTFLVPKGTANVALKKPVTVSVPDSALGVITNITDGSAKDDGGEHVALEGGLQWMQVDLGEAHRIWKVLLWHYHRMPVVYQDVVVMVSSDPEFRKDVKVIFNNDHDNSSGLGAGPDIAYVETNHGWLMDGAGAQGRYVRFYSNGNSYSEKNDYLEAMVFGTPVTPKVAMPKAAAPGAATNKPNDPDRMPTGFSKDEMVTRVMSFHTQFPFMGFFLRDSASKFPHLDKTVPPVMPRDGQVSVRITFPKGGDNVSQGKKVTSSAAPTRPADLRAFTDSGTGINTYIELPKGQQWMQIDLGARHHVWKILLWHYYQRSCAVADVIVQVSDDEQFTDGVTTIFNSDHDNSSGMGRGADAAYMETSAGKIIDGCDAKGRYVRFYSNGSSEGDVNRFTEAMVFGTPVAPKVDKPKAVTPSAETNKPNDPGRVPTGFTQADMVVTSMTFPHISPSISQPIDKKRFPHLDPNQPIVRGGTPSVRVSHPKGTKNVSSGKTVTSSAKTITSRDIQAFVDSNTVNSTFIELPAGQQWMQIDLGARHHVWKIALWLYHKEHCAVADVIVQVSDDERFSEGVTTIFNNDHDNSSGMGRGADAAYAETTTGRVIDGCDAKGRYVRFYTNGSSASDLNRFTEAMVFGTPVNPAGSTPDAAPSDPTRPTQAQLDAVAAHKTARDPLAPPPGIPESQLVTIRPLRPSGSGVPSVMHSAVKLVHQEEHNTEVLKSRESFQVPEGTIRVSAGKPVTTSDRSLANPKDLAYITDGHVRMQRSPFVSLAEGLQWVQIDLQAPHRIWKVLLWHDATRFDVYEDVLVQLSSDPEFAKDVVTIFNNDIDNTSGLGKGPDPAYVETYFGRLMDGGGHTARYVRFYSRGNTLDRQNCYLEAAIYGTPQDEVKPTPEPNAPLPTMPNNPLAPSRMPFPSELMTVTPAYPKALYTASTSFSHPDAPHLEKLDLDAVQARLSFEVPRWSNNLAKRKTVTSSAPPLVEGSLSKLVDEDADGKETSGVTLPAGTQWVQIDLGARSYVWKVLLWHAHPDLRAAHDVIVQVSEDPTFASGVQTIFNNDHDNSSGLGKGLDPAYLASSSGRLIDGCGARGRYVRVTSRGSTASPLNHFAEVMVFGKRTLKIWAGASAGEAELPLAEVRARENAQTSDTMRTMPMYPAPAPENRVVKVDPATFPHFEKRDWIKDHMRLELRAPLRSYTNIAKNKPVLTSAPTPDAEERQRATNGVAYHDDVLRQPKGLQWVQVDLGADYRIWNMVLWHDHSLPVVYQDVVVQVSSDPEFQKDVTTVFNNDHDNSSKLGSGKDPAYVETHLGRHVETPGVLGRYVRFYSNGNSEDATNQFCEAWVYGDWEPGIPGSVEPSRNVGGEPSITPPPEGNSIAYERDYGSYTVSFASTGPFSVQKKDFPHLEQFDYEKEKSRMTLVHPRGVRVLRCESFSSSSPESAVLKSFSDTFVAAPSDPVLPGGLQWMQVDLGKPHDLWFVRLWHHINDLVVYHDVVVLASEDPEFKTGVHTLFNNDHDNSSGLGKGADPAYLETQFGRLIPGLGLRARYIRVYSRGNSREDVNRFSELKVYGREAKETQDSYTPS